jgi:hypothetical protein
MVGVSAANPVNPSTNPSCTPASAAKKERPLFPKRDDIPSTVSLRML